MLAVPTAATPDGPDRADSLPDSRELLKKAYGSGDPVPADPTGPPPLDSESSRLPTQPPPPIVSPPPPPPRILTADEAGYRSPVTLARVLFGLFLAWAVLEPAAVAESIGRYRFYDRILTDPGSVTFGQEFVIIDREFLVFAVTFVAWVLTGVVFLVWLRRVYSNIAALRGRPPRHSKGWVVGSWFVPFLNFVRPKQIVNDVWVASEPDFESTPDFQEVGPPRFLIVWWVLFLAASFSNVGSEDASTLEGVRTFAGVEAASRVAELLAAIGALFLVRGLSERQERRAGMVLAGYEPRLLGGVSARLAVPLILLMGASTAFLALDRFDEFPADSQLAALEAECSEGDFESCDVLWIVSPAEGDALLLAQTCGGRRASGSDIACTVDIGDGVDLARWRSACGSRDYGACDLLYLFSELGSADDEFGQTCGNRLDPFAFGCVLRFGLGEPADAGPFQ